LLSLREAGKKRSKAVHLLQKSVTNVIWLMVPVSDWLIIMIGPGGLLLGDSHLFRVLKIDGWRDGWNVRPAGWMMGRI
jgi:hypothetical protein